MNIQLVFPLDIPLVRFTTCAFIGHWSSGCYNIMDTVEIEIFFKRHKERTLIDVIGGQKWRVILGISWLAHHNPEID